MKKIVLGLVLLLSSFDMSKAVVGYDWQFLSRNGANNGVVTSNISVPAANAPAFWFQAGDSAHLPSFALLDEGLYYDAPTKKIYIDFTGLSAASFGLGAVALSNDYNDLTNKPTLTTGPQGVKGDKGDTGDVGSTGSQGVKGDVGDVGAQGVVGSTGPTGDTGAAGSTGSQGIQGVKGDTGLTGSTGTTGVTGSAGSNGTNGTNGTNATIVAYEGITQRTNAFPIFKTATVSSNVAVFNLTADGTSGGTALFPNGVIADSVNLSVSDATASYQMSWAFSNSNKTLTVTANKLTTANILTGILGQTAANTAVIKIQVWGY